MKDGGSQVQGELYRLPRRAAVPWREELGAGGLEVHGDASPAGPGQAKSSTHVLLVPRHSSATPAHGNTVCRSVRSLDNTSSCAVVFPRSRGTVSRSDRKRRDALVLDMVVGQAGRVGGRSPVVLSVTSGVWADLLPGEEGSMPVTALGVSGAVGVPGLSPVLKVEMPRVVPAVVPVSWLGARVLLGTLVMVLGVAVVSARVVKGSDEAAVGAGVVEGEMLLVPRDMLEFPGVEVPVSGLEGVTVPAVLDSAAGSSAEVSMGVREAG